MLGAQNHERTPGTKLLQVSDEELKVRLYVLWFIFARYENQQPSPTGLSLLALRHISTPIPQQGPLASMLGSYCHMVTLDPGMAVHEIQLEALLRACWLWPVVKVVQDKHNCD